MIESVIRLIHTVYTKPHPRQVRQNASDDIAVERTAIGVQGLIQAKPAGEFDYFRQVFVQQWLALTRIEERFRADFMEFRDHRHQAICINKDTLRFVQRSFTRAPVDIVVGAEKAAVIADICRADFDQQRIHHLAAASRWRSTSRRLRAGVSSW